MIKSKKHSNIIIPDHRDQEIIQGHDKDTIPDKDTARGIPMIDLITIRIIIITIKRIIISTKIIIEENHKDSIIALPTTKE